MREKSQASKIISQYLSDIAKGLILGSSLAQTLTDLPLPIKLVASILNIAFSLFFLFLSIEYSKGGSYDQRRSTNCN